MAGVRQVLLVLVLILASSPALAGVSRFTSAQGTIHITNMGPQSQEDRRPDEGLRESPIQTGHQDQELTRFKDAVGTTHLSNVASPLTGPRPVAESACQPQPVSPGKASLNAPVTPVAAVSQEEAKPAEAGSVPEPRKPALSPGLPAGPQQEKNPLTKVARFKDQAGTIHITNPRPEPEPAVAQARGAPVTPEVRGPEAGPVRPTLVAASFASPLPGLRLAGLSGTSPPGDVGSGVRRYRDSKGVWHVVNTPRPPEPGPMLAAAPGPIIQPATAALPEYYRPPLPMAGATTTIRRDKAGTIRFTNSPPLQARPAPEDLQPLLVEAALTYFLPVPLVAAVIKAESNFVPTAVSPKGAMGLMQLMPGTAQFLGVRDPFCPRENVLSGCRYLRLLLDSFNQSLPLALAAYNAGYQRVIDAGFQVPDIKETQSFVSQVLGHYYLAAPMGQDQARLRL